MQFLPINPRGAVVCQNCKAWYGYPWIGGAAGSPKRRVVICIFAVIISAYLLATSSGTPVQVALMALPLSLLFLLHAWIQLRRGKRWFWPQT